MTCKEICECIYKSFCTFSENIALIVEFILQVLTWLFLVVTAPLWLIPYMIIKKTKECEEFMEGLKERLGEEDVP
jgi:hypothetical protein